MTPYRLLHCADLHLDRAFVERDLARSAAARRQALRDAFLRIVERARTCDALVVAGDLYEHEHVTGDTANMLVHAFASLECRVLLLPGNHDPHLPGSVYERAPWPAAAPHPRPAPARLGLRARARARERARLPPLGARGGRADRRARALG